MSSAYEDHEVEQEKVNVRKYEVDLAILKQRYLDHRINPNIEQEREDINDKYIFSMLEANAT